MSIKIKEKSLLPKECIEKLRTLAKHLKPEDSALEHEAYCEDLLEQIESLTCQLETAKTGLNLFADVTNWQLAGTYKGEASGVYIWNGWLSGIKGNPFEIAAETLVEMERIKCSLTH
jgi:hypothetical protein